MYGCSSIVEYSENHGIPHDVCGASPDILYTYEGDGRKYYACSIHKNEVVNDADQVVALRGA